jgi:hypothetical protein
MGLAPSPKNVIVQIYNQKVIDQPIISFSRSIDEMRISHYYFTLGNYSKIYNNWFYLNSTIKHAWILNSSRIQINDIDFGNNLVSFLLKNLDRDGIFLMMP